MAPPSLQLEAGKGAMPTNAPIQATLDPDQTAAARQWAADTDLGAEAIQQLQTSLGIDPTGVYDDATINAVYNRQVTNNEGKSDNKKGKEDGIADKTFFKQHGLLFTGKITNAKAMPDFVRQILDEDGNPKPAFQNGITVGCYTHYDDQKENNQTFWKVANPWAKHNSAIGINEAGELQIGVPLKVTETHEIVEMVQSISRSLQEVFWTNWNATVNDYFQGPVMVPAWTQVKNLAIFAHGMPYGVGTDAGGAYRDGLVAGQPDDRKYRETAPNIESFADGLQGAIKNDVNVQLFACNAAREFDEENHLKKSGNEHRQRPDGQEMGGDTSFAARLQEELGEDSTVFGHLTAGHTTNNFTSLAYGKLAGEDGVVHIFDVLYPDTFIDSELLRLFPELTEEQRMAIRPGLRDEMWSHYKSSISDEYLRQAGKTQVKHWKQPKQTEEQKAAGIEPEVVYRQLGERLYEEGIPDLGAEMFTNTEACRTLMNQNFSDVWMTDKRIKNLKKG